MSQRARSRYFGTMTNETLVAVPLFVFMGIMLEKSRIAENLLEAVAAMFGRVRGGLVVAVLLVGAILAASTGIVGATVVAMGLISLPTMLRHGYDPKLACGAICASGTLGQVIPPSLILVLLGDQLGNAYQQAQLKLGNYSPKSVSVGDLFAGALLRPDEARLADWRATGIEAGDGIVASIFSSRDGLLASYTLHNRTAAAKVLGITFRALRYRMERLGINRAGADEADRDIRSNLLPRRFTRKGGQDLNDDEGSEDGWTPTGTRRASASS